MNETKELERESWVDFVRVIAIFLVVLLHAAAPWVYRYGLITNSDWQIANIIDSVTRVSVPLFFMSTGYLLLSKPLFLSTYFKKRVSRVAIPWIAWSIIYLLYRNYLTDEIITIPKGIFAFLNGDIYFHFWFLYTLIGLYLLIPVISWFLESNPQKRSIYFLIVWFVTVSLVPFFNTFSRYISSNELEIAFDLSMFGGFSGYLIAGFLIGSFTSSKPQWRLMLSLYVLGVALTIIATMIGTFRLDRLIEYFYDYAAPNVILSSFAAFSVLKKVGIFFSQNKKVSRIFARMGYASLGIYLIHPIIFNTLDDVILNSALAIPLVALITFLLSYLAVTIMLRIPVIGRIV